MGTPCIRWTADTERAFLLALRQTKQVTRAAAAIGRAPGVCYDRRRRRPDFAAAWDAALADMEGERLAEVAAATGTELTVRPLTRARRDGWTQQRQRSFVRALADTGSYGQAAKRVGISMTSVQRLRRHDPAFQALCDKALIEGGMTLEEAAYVRATEGWEEPVVQGGQVVAYRRRYSDTLAKVLLEREKAAGVDKRKRWEKTPASAADARREILRKVAAVTAAQQREQRRAQLEWAARMEQAGWAP